MASKLDLIKVASKLDLESGAFRFLHISDVHFDRARLSETKFRERIVQKIREDKLPPADCLIISGDLFNRGSLQANPDDSKAFLESLPLFERHMLVVPGNHDVKRSAMKEGPFGANHIYRQDLVRKKAESVKQREGTFTLDDSDKEVLYRETFRWFLDFSRAMCFENYTSDSPLDVEHYEVQVCHVPFHIDSGASWSTGKVRFVLLNTALIAGQSLSEDERQSRVDELMEVRRQAYSNDEFDKETEACQKIVRYTPKGSKDVIIDDEPINGKENCGRMSLSKDGQNFLYRLDNDDSILTVFVGHHGYQFLSEETQEALKAAMRKCHSSIYLCGHAHKAGYDTIKLNANSFPENIRQFQAGVMFKDKEESNQFGFNYGSFTWNGQSLSARVISYFLLRSPSEDWVWVKEEHTIPPSELPFFGLTVPPKDPPPIKPILPHPLVGASDRPVSLNYRLSG